MAYPKSLSWCRSGRALAVAVVALATVPDPAFAAADLTTAGERPRIGLVLGGGGAKGAAHIGVLKVLEELHVPIDCIAGTSMGALVGATYAAGMRATDIEATVRGIDWASTLGSQDLRERMPIEEKLADVNYSNNLDLGIKGGRLRGRGGLIATQDVEGLLTELVASAQFTQNFDELPIPFRAVATDMIAGEMVVIGAGDLAVAMRASMAIPGAFTPVRVDGRLLADGGVMRNLPVDVARDLCADVVIAVWLSSPPPDESDLLSTVGMVNRSLDVMVGANQRAQIASLATQDVGIEVPVGDIGSADFQRVGDAIDLGLAAGAGYRDALRRYALPVDEYQAWSRNVRGKASPKYPVAKVEIAELERVNPAYVRSQLLASQPGEKLGIADIVADTRRIYALGDFERVEYRLGGTRDARELEIRPVEKSWGPDFISFDYGLATRDGADLNALLRADHERTWINSLGARWHNALQFGRKSLLATRFYQPLDVPQKFFVEPALRAENTLEDIYIEETRAATYEIRELYGQADFGVNFGTRAQVRLGLRHGWQSADLETGTPGLPELDRETDSSLQFRLIYDTRDNVALPTHGSLFSVRFAESLDWFGSELDYSLVEAVLAQAFDLNGNSLSLVFGGAETLSGETPVSQLIELGGIRTFPGLRPGELRGSEYWFAGTSYAWRLADISPIFGHALYGGFRLQAGEMREEFGEIDSGVLYGLSGSLNGRTPIGPFVLSLGYVIDRQVRLQFMLGRPVPEGSMLDDLQ